MLRMPLTARGYDGQRLRMSIETGRRVTTAEAARIVKPAQAEPFSLKEFLNDKIGKGRK